MILAVVVVVAVVVIVIVAVVVAVVVIVVAVAVVVVAVAAAIGAAVAVAINYCCCANSVPAKQPFPTTEIKMETTHHLLFIVVAHGPIFPILSSQFRRNPARCCFWAYFLFGVIFHVCLFV